MSTRSSSTGFKKLLKIDDSWSNILVAAFAELLGSAILIFIGCMGCVGSLSAPSPHLQVALTFGFAVGSIVHLIGHISGGHITPIVSICTVILGLKSITTAAIYILAQTMGAIIGYGMLRVVTPADYLHAGNSSATNSFCVSTVNENISSFQGLLVEAVGSGILIFFVCALVDPRNKNDLALSLAAIKFGALISMLAMAIGPYTGCSLNPARSFGPALWNNNWSSQWVYWLGPITGTVIVSFVYKIVFWPKKSLDEDVPEGTALNSIDAEKP